MSSKILVLGQSGTGKTSSLRNLNPTITAIINTDRKELPIYGWSNVYKKILGADGKVDFNKTNYIETAKFANVAKAIEEWSKRDDLEIIVLDTITHMLTDFYIRETIGKDFKQYQMIAKHFYDVLEKATLSGKHIIVFGHTDTKFNDVGEKQIDLRSYGNMITNMEPASYFTTVLMTEVRKTEGGREYLFRTETDGSDPAKAPVIFKGGEVVRALPVTMPNDIAEVLHKLDLFNQGKLIDVQHE